MYWSKNHCRLLAVFVFTFWNIDFVCKSSRRLVFCEIPALIFFPEFIGKQLSGRLLSSKVRGRKLQFDLKKRLHRKRFPVTFVNILGFSEWFFHKIISGGCLCISFCISLFLFSASKCSLRKICQNTGFLSSVFSILSFYWKIQVRETLFLAYLT